MGLFDSVRERVRSLLDDEDEERRERPAASDDGPSHSRSRAPARSAEEHEEEDEGGGGLLGVVATAIRNPRQAAASIAGAAATAVGGPAMGAVVAPMVNSGLEIAGNAVDQAAHGVAGTGAAALRAVGAEDAAASVESAPDRVAHAAGDLQESAAHAVDHDLRQTLVGNGEDGEGLIGQIADAAEAGQDSLITGIGQVRAIVREPHVARAIEAASLGALTSDEIIEETEDITRGLHDVIDEDMRDMIAGEHVQGLSDEAAQFRLDGDAQLEVERRARELFNATDGVGTAPEEITASLRGADPQTIQAMEALMWREHHIDMRHMLDRELSGSAEDEIFGSEDGPAGMLSGDPVEQAMSEIDGATHGMITDAGRIEDAIRDVPEDRRAEVIERMGGADAMRDRLSRETRGQDPAGTDAEVASALLENREADAIALRLDESLNRGIGETLGRAIGIDDQDISDADRQVQGWMLDTVGDMLGADDEARARAAREMGPHSPYYAAIHDLIGNQDEVAEQLEHIPPDQREAVQQSFARITRGDQGGLEETLAHEMEEGPERDRAVALLHGDQAAADAAALQLAADQPLLSSSEFVEHLVIGPIAVAEDLMNGGRPDVSPTDLDGFMHPLERREGETLEQFQQRQQQMRQILHDQYGSDLDQLMSHELGEGSLDYQRAHDLSDDGEMDWRLQVRYAAEREIGTDDDMYLEGLRRAAADPTLTDEERAQLRDQAFESPLSELDGRPALEAQEILEGPPADDAARVDRWIRRHELDRDTLGGGLVDLHSQSGTDYDRHLEELQAIRDRMDGGTVREEDRARFDELGRILDGDQDSYRTRQDETAEAAAEAAAAAAALTVTVASAGSLSPVAAAALSATVGGVAGMGMRGAVLGDAYEREDIAADALRTAASAAGGAAGEALQAAAAPTNILERALVEVPGTALEHGTDLALSDEHLTWGTVGQHVAQGGAEVLGSALGSTAEHHVGEHLGDGLASEVIASSTGGLIENSTTTALDGETWEDGVQQGLLRVAGHGARGAAESAVTSTAQHHAEERRSREAAREALAGSEPRHLAPGESHAGDEFRAGLHESDAPSSSEGHVVDPAAAAAADADTADSLVGQMIDDHHVQQMLEPSTPRPLAPGEPDAVDEFRADLEASERARSEAERAAAHAEPEPEPVLGSRGRPFDPDYVPGPYEPINYPPNDGAVSTPVADRLTEGTPLHRRGHEGGNYLAPESSSIAERAMPPEYYIDPEPLHYTPEEHYYEVGRGGLDVSTSEVAPAFGQPGGGTQYQTRSTVAGEEPPRVGQLVRDGSLVETQANFAQPASEAEQEEIRIAVEEEAAREAAQRGGGSGHEPPDESGGGPPGGPGAPGIDARHLLALQAEHGSEVAVSAPRLADGTVGEQSTITIGSEDGVSVPEGHVGSVHTHPGATDDPRVRFPSDGQGDLGSVRRHGNTQAVVHDEGVTVFHPGSSTQDIDGLVGEQGSVQPVARRVDNVTSVDTTQVVMTHDPDGSVVISPSPDNPEQGVLPVSFPQGDFYAPGTSEGNVDALREHNEARQQEAVRVAEEAEAARAASAGRPIVGWTRSQQPVYEGEPATEPWQDAQGRMHFPEED